MTGKVGLLDMVLWAEREADRIDVWKTVLEREGKALDPGVARTGLIARRAQQTLELLMVHEQAFRDLVRAGRRR
jgi:hypothetical protein